jgi:hypothetical protein
VEFIKKVATALVGGEIIRVTVGTILTTMIVGTSVSDVLIVHTLPIIVGAGAFFTVLKLFLA